MKKLLKMGFHESVVPQVFDGKISTWRLRDHKFKKGDVVAFENSQTEGIFGFGRITKVIKTTVGQIDLNDKTHYKTYKNRQELIKAFKRHNPAYKVNNNTPVFAYTYKFIKNKIIKKPKSPILTMENKIQNHKIAAEKIERIKNRTFEFIKRNLGKVSEYDAQEFVLSEYKKEGMVTLRSDKKYIPESHPPQIIAVNENAANPHYFPSKRKSKIIRKNDLILVDIWARLKRENSHFADITWMAYSGKQIPKEIQETFNKVIKARDIALEFIKSNLGRKKLPKTKDIDRITRNYFKRFGLDRYFIHRTGHSLGLHVCHGKYFRLGQTSDAKLRPNIPFTIEPGLYFKNKFGIRSEINCYVTKDFKLIITTKIQRKIIKI